MISLYRTVWMCIVVALNWLQNGNCQYSLRLHGLYDIQKQHDAQNDQSLAPVAAKRSSFVQATQRHPHENLNVQVGTSVEVEKEAHPPHIPEAKEQPAHLAPSGKPVEPLDGKDVDASPQVVSAVVDSIGAAAEGGCIAGDEYAQTRDGPKQIKHLSSGEDVLTISAFNGSTRFTPVIFQLHPPNSETRKVVTIVTRRGWKVSLTPEHLVFVSKKCRNQAFQYAQSVTAAELKVGSCIFMKRSQQIDRVELDKISAVQQRTASGLYAPVTKDGTILVNGLALSCYSYLRSHFLAHNLFASLQYLPEKSWTHLQQMFYEMSLAEIWDWVKSLAGRVTFSDEAGVCFRN